MAVAKKSKAKESYMEVTELSKELHNLKLKNPDGKNVKVLEAKINKKYEALTPEQIDAVASWADAIPE